MRAHQTQRSLIKMSKKLTLEEVNIKLKEKNIHIDNYINAATSVTAECLVCGHKWSVKPYSILHASGCPICNHKNAGKKIAISKIDFLNKYENAKISNI